MSTLSVRRPLSVLAVLAMVATMLFAVVGTASAATAMPSNPALFSACPSNAGIPDGGFTDVPAGSFFDDAVNCLAYYGVTQGTALGVYGPGDNVTRAQMALFLARSAAAAGVVLASSPPSAGFTDIGGLSAEAQKAINQLAAAGIVKGKTATTFAPSDTVWRQQMALFLTRFLGKAKVGPGGTALTGAATSGAPFTDLSNTTVEASKAINQAWDLGVATGTTVTTFDPLGTVNRGQMALFLTRLWDHTNTRPAGVNVQAAPVSGFSTFASKVSVTARGTDFLPSVDTIVDIWRFNPTTTVTSPFNTNGSCNTASGTISQLQSGGAACKVDLIDSTTDLNGNWPAFTVNATNGASSSFYAWTGAVGAVFNSSSTTYSMTSIASAKDATSAKLTTDMSTSASKVKFGDTVTLTVQLMNGTAPVAKAGVEYTFTDVKTVDGAPGNAGTTVTKIKTDASGKAVYQVTQADPSATANNAGSNKITVTGTPSASGSPVTVNWDDDAAVVSTVTQATATKYKVQSNGATNAVTATVYDQYGDTMAGQTVNFTSTNDSPSTNEVQTIDRSNIGTSGTFTLTYGSETTASISISAANAAVESAIEALPSITNVTVTGGTPWIIEFVDPGAQDIALPTITPTGLDSGSTITISETTKGSSPAVGIGATPVARTTNSAGVATLGYTWNWGTNAAHTAKETITAKAGTITATTVAFYWVDAAVDGTTATATSVLVADVASGAVVGVPGAAYTVWTWQAGDQFFKNAAPTTQSVFETEIAKTTVTSFQVDTYWATTAGTSAFRVNP